MNWNGWRDTDACLESLARLEYTNYQIVVVDNASADGSEEKLRERHPELTLLQSGANLGFAGGNNVGLRYALDRGAEYVWLLNNDTLVEPDALTQLVAKTQREPALGLCGSTLLYEAQRDTVQALGGAHYNRWLGTVAHLGQHEPWPQKLDTEKLERRVEGRLSYLIGASMLASRRFLETVGLLQPDYFLYFEELDWAARARGRFRLGYAASKYRLSQGGLEYRRHRPGQSRKKLHRRPLRSKKSRALYPPFLPLRPPYRIFGAICGPRQPAAAAAVAARHTYSPGHAARRQRQRLASRFLSKQSAQQAFVKSY